MAALTFNERFSIRLDKMLDEAIEKEKEILAAGKLMHEDYKFHSGQIQGLRTAKKLVVDADTELMKQ